jgi:hypothetical protein
MASHRILYAGDDIHLPARLRDALQASDCFVVRSPVESARTLIRSDIKYSLLLFDDDSRGAELEAYARTLGHRGHTPVVKFKESEGFGKLVSNIRRKLAGL